MYEATDKYEISNQGCEVSIDSQLKKTQTWKEQTTDNKIALLRDIMCELLMDNANLKRKVHELTCHRHAGDGPLIPVGASVSFIDELQYQLQRLQK